jgi:L-ascorbate metabolism protein UlaG (beta-lactamase superfamily)
MIITHHGADFFKVSFGDTTIAVNPISKDSSVKGARFGSDITLVSVLHSPEHNGVEATSRGDRASFVVSGPGEYEISGVFIKGFLSKSHYGGVDRYNTIYTVSLEGIQLGFLGALGETSLSAEAKEALDTIDILFVPIGGEGVLTAQEASKLAVEYEPKLIIPSHYIGVGAKNSISVFLKEYGAEKVSPIDKLTIKKKDLDGKEGEVVCIDSTN